MIKKAWMGGLGSLLLLTASYSQAIEGEFVTIIAPDGHPMVVPLPRSTKSKSKVPPAATVEENKVLSVGNTAAEPTPTIAPAIQPANSVLADHSLPSAGQNTGNWVKSTPTPNVAVTSNTPDTAPPLISPTQNQSSPSVDSRSKSGMGVPTATAATSSSSQSATSAPYQTIDGEKYYAAEYLESKEFNLEGKKRFYQIPSAAGGGANWQVVEREKGVDQSWFKSKTEVAAPRAIALGVHYAVLNQADLVAALPMQCVDKKAQSRAKTLQAHKELALFPRPAFGTQFDYQLVELKQSPTYVSLLAFADRVDNPHYYWPLAVFLDDNGCVIEGASAFFSQAYAATPLQNAAIEGILRVPNGSRFILLTPLQQAVDVPHVQLSNQGQVKLTVLR